jgi:hypothetical protein
MNEKFDQRSLNRRGLTNNKNTRRFNPVLRSVAVCFSTERNQSYNSKLNEESKRVKIATQKKQGEKNERKRNNKNKKEEENN